MLSDDTIVVASENSSLFDSIVIQLHGCWRRMLETKCVGDNYKMFVTILAILVTNIHYLFTLASCTNIQKMLPTSNFVHQHPKIVINFKVTIITVTFLSYPK